MTGTLLVGILAAVVALVLVRFAAKQPWVVAAIAAVVVLVAIILGFLALYIGIIVYKRQKRKKELM